MGRSLTLSELVEKAHGMAKGKGWWEGTHNLPEKLALIHSEVSEALEAYRDRMPPVFYADGGKPEGLAVELADAVIRIADLCGYLKVDLADVIAKKMAYNATRPHRHGGRKC
jgi:NTP pyrophosphatase (non-canonical NTP hydrolase)